MNLRTAAKGMNSEQQQSENSQKEKTLIELDIIFHLKLLLPKKQLDVVCTLYLPNSFLIMKSPAIGFLDAARVIQFHYFSLSLPPRLPGSFTPITLNKA